MIENLNIKMQSETITDKRFPVKLLKILIGIYNRREEYTPP